MSGEPFCFCKSRNVMRGLSQSLFGIINVRIFFYEIVHGKRREKPCCSRCGQHMVGAGVIISERFRCVIAKENASGVFDFIKKLKRVLYHQFKMFGCNFVCEINRVFCIFANDYSPVVLNGFFNYLFTRKRLYLPVYAFGNTFCFIFRKT